MFDELKAVIQGDVTGDPAQLEKYSHDASLFDVKPEAVVLPKDSDDLKEVLDQADIDGPLVDYKEKGSTVELIGKEDLDGSPAYKLKVVEKNGDIRYIFLDGENYLEIKSAQKRKTPNGELEIETYQSDYKPVDGVVFAHAYDTKVQGQSASQIKLTKIEINPAIDDSIFKIPTTN